MHHSASKLAVKKLKVYLTKLNFFCTVKNVDLKRNLLVEFQSGRFNLVLPSFFYALLCLCCCYRHGDGLQ